MDFFKTNYKTIALRFLLNGVISFLITLFLSLCRYESLYVDFKIKMTAFILLSILISLFL